MKIKPEEVEKRSKAFSNAFRRYGLKSTYQRAEIYRELARTEEHPDVETIYARVRSRIPAISLDTVYRTLRLLEKKGIISRVGAIGERARFDANSAQHHHFICTKCGFIGDFYNEELNGFSAPSDVAAMGKVNSIHVELRGICKKCQRKKGSSK